MRLSRASPRRRRCRCGPHSTGSVDIGASGLPASTRAAGRTRASGGACRMTCCRLAEGLALQRPPFGPSAIYREVCRVARARGEQPPGYHTIYNVIRAIPDDLKTLAVNGEKAYREAYDLVHRREAERPNQIWQADHTQLDLWAKRDDGQTARPWLTVIIDDYSRAIAGFFVSFDSPSAAANRAGSAPGDLAESGRPLDRLRHPRDFLHGQRQRLHLDPPRTGRRRHQDAADLFHARPAARPRPHRAVLRDRQSDVPLHACPATSGRAPFAAEPN